MLVAGPRGHRALDLIRAEPLCRFADRSADLHFRLEGKPRICAHEVRERLNVHNDLLEGCLLLVSSRSAAGELQSVGSEQCGDTVDKLFWRALAVRVGTADAVEKLGLCARRARAVVERGRNSEVEPVHCEHGRAGHWAVRHVELGDGWLIEAEGRFQFAGDHLFHVSCVRDGDRQCQPTAHSDGQRA